MVHKDYKATRQTQNQNRTEQNQKKAKILLKLMKETFGGKTFENCQGFLTHFNERVPTFNALLLNFFSIVTKASWVSAVMKLLNNTRNSLSDGTAERAIHFFLSTFPHRRVVLFQNYTQEAHFQRN